MNAPARAHNGSTSSLDAEERKRLNDTAIAVLQTTTAIAFGAFTVTPELISLAISKSSSQAVQAL